MGLHCVEYPSNSVSQVIDSLRVSVDDVSFSKSLRPGASGVDSRRQEASPKLPSLLPSLHEDSRKREGVETKTRSQVTEVFTASSHPAPAVLPPVQKRLPIPCRPALPPVQGGLPILGRQTASNSPREQADQRGRNYITDDVTRPLKSHACTSAPCRDTHPRDAAVHGIGANTSGANNSGKILRLSSDVGSEIDGSMLSPQTATSLVEHKTSGPITYAPSVFAQVHHEELEKKYDILDWLGNGSGCSVVTIQNRATGKMYACKCMQKFDHDKISLLKEIEIFKKLDHRNIVRLYETLESDDTLYLVMELCHGDLFDHIHKHGGLSEKEARAVGHQVLSALAYMHANNVIHCDVKPENCLLEATDSQSLKVKLTDFGISAAIRPAVVDNSTWTRKWRSYCEGRQEGAGSTPYMAPEILMGYKDSASKVRNSTKCDLWSVGALLYVIVSDRLPFATPEETCRGRQVTFEGECWKNVSETLKDLIRNLMNHDIEQRLTAQEALQHEWFHDEKVYEEADSLECTPDQLAQILLSNLKAWDEKRALLRLAIHAMARQLSDDCPARRLADLAYEMFGDTSNTLTCAQLHESLRGVQAEKQSFISNNSINPIRSAREAFKRKIKQVRRQVGRVVAGLPRIDIESAEQPSFYASYVDNQLKDLVSTVDAENHGIVDYTLLVAAMLPREFYCDDTRITEIFHLFDISQRGSIRPQDLRAVLKCRDFPGRFSAMVHECDFDGDGCINLEDFRAMFHGKTKSS
eukprot:CAMPEP_0169137294 /NCGR_PEP_ID=MMETSP1015-20121227/41449_1 /TAXON_ID=342587 /ORGANISM="Karlodinium micrum, Strain CCMP2283" /LENGTH=751 /DNA_ID=CAMNT_0009202103 /DNA_START=92 /DNA_END=2347 /DNA_ORIENTATION=-